MSTRPQQCETSVHFYACCSTVPQINRFARDTNSGLPRMPNLQAIVHLNVRWLPFLCLLWTVEFRHAIRNQLRTAPRLSQRTSVQYRISPYSYPILSKNDWNCRWFSPRDRMKFTDFTNTGITCSIVHTLAQKASWWMMQWIDNNLWFAQSFGFASNKPTSPLFSQSLLSLHQLISHKASLTASYICSYMLRSH